MYADNVKERIVVRRVKPQPSTLNLSLELFLYADTNEPISSMPGGEFPVTYREFGSQGTLRYLLSFDDKSICALATREWPDVVHFGPGHRLKHKNNPQLLLRIIPLRHQHR